MGAFAGISAETVDDLYARAIATDPTRPLLTWYDDRTGERIELSGTTLDNWIAKTANLLVDGCGLDHGDTATVLLPPHWQTAAVLLGCWRAGLQVRETRRPEADLPPPAKPQTPGAQALAHPHAPGPPEPPPDVLFTGVPPAALPGPATTDGERSAVAGPPGGALLAAGERFVLGFAPLGAPLREVPPGFADYVAEVRGQGDRFTPYRAVAPLDPARPGQTHGDLCRAAAERAEALGIEPGARVLIDAGAFPDPLDWLLAPLAAGASTVLCAGLDPGAVPARIEAERVTVRLRPVTASPE